MIDLLEFLRRCRRRRRGTRTLLRVYDKIDDVNVELEELIALEGRGTNQFQK